MSYLVEHTKPILISGWALVHRYATIADRTQKAEIFKLSTSKFKLSVMTIFKQAIQAQARSILFSGHGGLSEGSHLLRELVRHLKLSLE